MRHSEPIIHHEQPKAYPIGQWDGMDMRDYFAAKALQGFCVEEFDNGSPSEWDWESIADDCYKAADALMKARNL